MKKLFLATLLLYVLFGCSGLEQDNNVGGGNF